MAYALGGEMGPRTHGRTKQRVCDMFEEEKALLKPLPQEKFKFFKQVTRTVWEDGFIQVNNSYYCSQPAELSSQVIVRIYDNEIEIIAPCTMSIIRRHKKSIRPGSVSQLEKDRVYNPSRQTENLLSDAGKIGPQTKVFCESLLKVDKRTGNKQMRGVLSLTT